MYTILPNIKEKSFSVWYSLLKNGSSMDSKPNIQLDKLSRTKTLKTKDIYWMIVPLKHDTVNISNPNKYWVDKYKLSYDTLRTVYILPYTVTKVTYIQSLQYKILYKIVNCNYWLKKVDFVRKKKLLNTFSMHVRL